MIGFKKYLENTIEDNRLEQLMPSREYSDNEVIFMEGYQQALQDMLKDFDKDFDKFMKTYHTYSLN